MKTAVALLIPACHGQGRAPWLLNDCLQVGPTS